MNSEAEWIAHLEEHPGDAHPALAFADWLEDTGKPAHAEIIRLHHHPKTKLWFGNNDGGLRGVWSRESTGLTPSSLQRDKSYVVKRFKHSPDHVGPGTGYGENEMISFGASLPHGQAGHLHAALREEER